ncbi:MAG: HAMP domain-containing histidine kinase [Anaerolineales bacterium]|nr:HAMP domain-containing histidine kinase [Anaerolineales bacterium]
MSLRLRLTVLYSAFIVGVLAFFGATIYFVVNIILLNQVDVSLRNVATQIVRAAVVNPQGDLSLISFPTLDIASNAHIQIWSADGDLIAASPSVRALTQALDPQGLASNTTRYEDVYLQNTHLRVLNVPLVLRNRVVGTLQAASNLTAIDAAQSDLLLLMVVSAAFAAAFALVGSWVILGRALSPLQDIAETVDQINRAADLSRRVPVKNAAQEDMSDLIVSINQTLERLESLFTTQQRFLEDVSHELRTPLTVIKGNVDLMRKFKEADAESLNSIDQEVGRLTRLVSGLLTITKAESGKLALNLSRVDLDFVLTEAVMEIRVLAGDRVRFHLSQFDEAVVEGDRDQLKQLILNLASNAIQYTPEGGEVFFSLNRIGARARIIIRDTGQGIPAEDLPHIFERFYRAEKSRTRSQSGGFGLGLAIAKWIVEQHNGEIYAESKEGEGTTFVVWLNLAP